MYERQSNSRRLARGLCLAITEDPRLRALLDAALETAGAGVMSFATVEQATAWIWHVAPPLIVCDTILEGPAGLDPYRGVAAVARDRSVPILAITPWRELMFARDHFLLRDGLCCSVVFRPFSDALLLEELDRLFRHPGSRTA